MKKLAFVFLMLISSMLLTGCKTNTYEYKGNKIVYELKEEVVDDINANGAEIVVRKDQAFVEVSKKDYETYLKGEHKLKEKNKFYQYYFISLKKIVDNKFGTSDPLKIKDPTYGDLKLNFYGVYDYEITDIKKFMKSYLKDSEDAVVSVEGYVHYSVVESIKDEMIKSSHAYSDIPRYVNTYRDNALKVLEEKGIVCSNLKVQGINLTEDSQEKIEKIDKNISLRKLYINNTKWIAADNSEMHFFDNDFKWYQTKNVYTDNFQYGDFKFYMGDMAVEFITTDLKSYGITESELDNLFASDDAFNRENFVVFEINLVGYTIGGLNTEVNQAVYWYGFLLRDNQNLQVVNMNSAKYYNFAKKSA